MYVFRQHTVNIQCCECVDLFLDDSCEILMPYYDSKGITQSISCCSGRNIDLSGLKVYFQPLNKLVQNCCIPVERYLQIDNFVNKLKFDHFIANINAKRGLNVLDCYTRFINNDNQAQSIQDENVV